MSHVIRNQIEQLNKTIKNLKDKGKYDDLSDLPMIKNFLNKLEDLF